MTVNYPAQTMVVNYEWASNASELMNGRADAIAHVGKLLSGEWEAEQLTDIQEENLSVADPAYVKGYNEAWSSVIGLLSGIAVDDLYRL